MESELCSIENVVSLLDTADNSAIVDELKENILTNIEVARKQLTAVFAHNAVEMKEGGGS